MEQTYFEEFLAAYIECALWAETDGSTPNGGEPLDKNFKPEDLAVSTWKWAANDCRKFVDQNEALLKQAEQLGRGARDCGHDFWLTRNHHGTGFWDRTELQHTGDPDLGKQLSEAAHMCGEAHSYVYRKKIRFYA